MGNRSFSKDQLSEQTAPQLKISVDFISSVICLFAGSFSFIFFFLYFLFSFSFADFPPRCYWPTHVWSFCWLVFKYKKTQIVQKKYMIIYSNFTIMLLFYRFYHTAWVISFWFEPSSTPSTPSPPLFFFLHIAKVKNIFLFSLLLSCSFYFSCLICFFLGVYPVFNSFKLSCSTIENSSPSTPRFYFLIYFSPPFPFLSFS